MSRNRLACIVAVGLLLVLAPTAQAYLQITPLRIHQPERQYEVGDEVDFTIEPENDTMAEEWKGRTLTLCYSFNAAERPADEEQPTDDGAVSSDDYVQRCLDARITLDDGARAAYQWTLPDEVQDHNVDVWLQADDEERIAFTYFAVGNAPPQMRAMSGNGAGLPEPGPVESEPTPDTTQQEGPEGADENTVPAIGILLLAAGVMAVALALPRRK